MLPITLFVDPAVFGLFGMIRRCSGVILPLRCRVPCFLLTLYNTHKKYLTIDGVLTKY
jgi:hypothetical protein